ncbi:MAG: hypothetical protein NTV68_12915 [Methanomicrobiales archaeon]|nr:hypothetical protein [Methanomicrobiales archaeon]
MTANVIHFTEPAIEHFRDPMSKICARQLIAEGLAIMLPIGGMTHE